MSTVIDIMPPKEDIVVFQYGNKVVSIWVPNYSEWKINADDLLLIDVGNIVGEILTWPVFLNRFGIIKAEVHNFYEKQADEFKLVEAELSQYHDKEGWKEYKRVGKEDGIKPTVQGTKNLVLLDDEWKEAKFKLLETKKDMEYIDSFSWSAIAKQKMLETINTKLSPEEFEKGLIESSVNGCMMKITKSQFKNK